LKVTRREAAAAVASAFGLAQASQPSQSQPAAPRREQHAVWAGAGDAGLTVDSVKAFVEKLARANIHQVVMCAKEGNGQLYWHSRRFPQAVSPRHKDFDLVENLVREAHAANIEVHLWLIDFHESENSVAFKEHPEWAQVSPDGKLTNTEPLFNRKYTSIWMCPAQRPGYTDQWLLPLIEELTADYPIDGIHHDYVRYCGDVAPDSYCFCDYCLKHIPRHALLRWETGPRERQRVEVVRPRMEANWEATPDMLPPGWDQYDRREKADFILHGRTLPGGPADMRYFFYEYRVDRINAFVRDAANRVRRINPNVKMSAAVFKNPIQSGRYLGQKWSDWTAWIDIFMPMSYRSHFLGDFQTYLDHLTEITARQLEWIRREQPLYAGIFTSDLYKEERGTGNFPPEKLERAIGAARKANPDGIALFSAGSLTRANQWPVLESIFR
jgi:uncharacterized lipoprotein YddW (UPF0748 family)